MPQQPAPVKETTSMQGRNLSSVTIFGTKSEAANSKKTVASVEFIRRPDANAEETQRITTALARTQPQLTRIKIGTATSGNTFYTADATAQKQETTAALAKETEFRIQAVQATSTKVDPSAKYHDSIKTIAVQ